MTDPLLTLTETVVPEGNTIRITEVNRNLAAGRFSYAIYKGRVARRAFRRGRPSYELVSNFTVGSGDKPTTREISLDCQLGKLLVTK